MHTNKQLKKNKILLVEDDFIISMVEKSILEEKGFLVDAVTSGEEAIEYFKKNANYDVIFMDIELPGINGALAAKEIRTIEKQKKIPATFICAVTSHEGKDFEKICQVMGINEFIIKPFYSEKLEALIQKHSKVFYKNEHSPNNNSTISDEVINANILLAHTHQDIHAASLLFNKFIKVLIKTKKELENELVIQDKVAFTKIIHSLKLKTTYLGAIELNKVAQEIEEKICLQNKLFKKSSRLYPKLMTEISRVLNTKLELH